MKFCLHLKPKKSYSWVFFLVIGIISSILVILIFGLMQNKSTEKQVLGEKTVNIEEKLNLAKEETLNNYHSAVASWQDKLTGLDDVVELADSAEEFFLSTKVPADFRDLHFAGLLDYQTVSESGEVDLIKEKLSKIAEELLGHL